MTHHDDDFAFEPVPGLPAHLPRGEQMLWQGKPKWQSLSWRGMYVRTVVVYFCLLMAWRVFEGVSGGGSLLAAAIYALELLPFMLGAVAVLVGLGWLYARSTIYTITDRRIVIRSGVALPVTVNLPFKVIENAALRLSKDGSGDIALKISKSQNVITLALWPNLRPWNFSRPEPTLRTVPDAVSVARLLSQALHASVSNPAAATSGVVADSVPARERANAEKPTHGLTDEPGLQGAMS